MQLWKEDQIQNAQKLLDYLLSNWLDEGGFRYTPLSYFTYFEFMTSAKNLLKRHIVKKVLNKLKTSSEKTCEEFEKVYLRLTKEHKTKKISNRKWIFYLPLDVKVSPDIQYPVHITLLGKEYKLVKKIPYSKKLKKEMPFQLYDYSEEILRFIESPDKIFWEVYSFGDEWGEAWDEISLSFEILRGIIEFTLGFRSFYTRTYSSPRANVPHPKWLLIRNLNNSYSGSIFNVIEYRHNTSYNISQRQLTFIKNNAKILRGMPSSDSTKQILISCLKLYADAMDGYFNYHQFLSLWHIAESISMSSEFGGKSEVVAKRLAHFGNNIGLIASGYQNILLKLSIKRNDLVHNGFTDITDEEINQLRFAIDTALLWLFKSSSKLKTKSQLSHYYKLKDLSPKELNSISSTIRVLTQSKS